MVSTCLNLSTKKMMKFPPGSAKQCKFLHLALGNFFPETGVRHVLASAAYPWRVITMGVFFPDRGWALLGQPAEQTKIKKIRLGFETLPQFYSTHLTYKLLINWWAVAHVHAYISPWCINVGRAAEKGKRETMFGNSLQCRSCEWMLFLRVRYRSSAGTSNLHHPSMQESIQELSRIK